MKGMMNPVYKQSSSIVCREIAGQTILVPIRQTVSDLESIYTLNETAALAWRMMDGQHSLEEIQAQIVQNYRVDPEPAGRDLFELVAQLLRLEAIESV